MMAKLKVAGAPISWGVSELRSWGHQMPPDRVFAEMNEVGLGATELGPPGYLPSDPMECRRLLDRHGLRLVAGFLAVVLHDRRRPALDEIEAQARALEASGAEVLVLAAALPGESYDRDERVSESDWTALVQGLVVAEKVASAHRLRLSFHPHAGTAVARKEDVYRLLESSSVAICLDTGHLYLGGADPGEIARHAARRVSHVHLKDVDANLAQRVRAGELSYAMGVGAGLYKPLGQGDLKVEEVVNQLRDTGYQGWYVLEQDTALTAEPAPAQGPIKAARQSLEYFRQMTAPITT
ncbi:MAG: sugar phosphate isomerase/epimerase [Candidatus Dormibacteraceae bacterium]